MPRHPHFASSIAQMPGSRFTELARRLKGYEGEVYPLHIGDTWLDPPEGCRMEDLRLDELPGLHQYTAPHGYPPLVASICERVRGRTGIATAPEDVLVTAGATGALAAVVGAIVDPGDEVLVLSPYWALFPGIVASANGVPAEFPVACLANPTAERCDQQDQADAAAAMVDALREKSSERTVAVYINTPNNPSGRVIPRGLLEAIVYWCRAQDLWIIADEVYEDYVYAGEHSYCRELAPERTISVHSFSKGYAMAGNRCGYAVGPAEAIAALRKVAAHAFYSTPTASQIAAHRALETADDWLHQTRRTYAELGARAADRLGVPAPQGSQFLFFDISDALGDGTFQQFLERCLQRGLFIAPGEVFGSWPSHIRVCYTAAPPDIVKRGIEVLAELLER